ncbi:MAG TPA: ferrous iron transport protein A [Candidatus Altiarchaeales archaeon]|nr:ferrous iron transport protein A [Candidatus Altiarchaeales archaeon]
MDNLSDLKKGESAIVHKLEGGECMKSQLRSMGLKEGSKLTVIAREPLGGPIVIKTHNTTLTIGRGRAHKIFVKK